MTTPIQGDLPDWSRPVPNETPLLIYTNSTAQPSSPATVTVTLPLNAVAVTLLLTDINITSVLAVGNVSGTQYLDAQTGDHRDLSYTTFPVFTAVDTELVITYTYLIGATQLFYVLAYTNLPPEGLQNNGALAVGVRLGSFEQLQGYLDQAISPGTPLTVQVDTGAPDVGQLLRIDAIFGRIGTTGAVDLANIFWNVVDEDTNTVVGRIGECDSSSAGFVQFAAFPNLIIPRTNPPTGVQMTYRNLDTGNVQMTMSMLYSFVDQ